MSDLRPLNHAAVLTRLGGDEALLHEIFALFAASAPELLARLEMATAADDDGEARRVVHQFKGSAAAVGAEGLLCHLEELAALLPAGPPARTLGSLGEVKREVARIECFIAEYLTHE